MCLALLVLSSTINRLLSTEPISKVSDDVEVVPPKCKITRFWRVGFHPDLFVRTFEISSTFNIQHPIQLIIE